MTKKSFLVLIALLAVYFFFATKAPTVTVLSEAYMMQVANGSEDKYMRIKTAVGKRWIVDDMYCFYYRFEWQDNDVFRYVNEGDEGLVQLGENSPAYGHIHEFYDNVRWVSGPVYNRDSAVRTYRGDVEDCYKGPPKGIPNLFETAQQSDIFYLDLVSELVLISNDSKTMEMLAVDF